MLRNLFKLLLALPSALAFSLSNFQEITSSSIPLGCLLSYDRQMRDCKKTDFSKGCSNDCVQNLLYIQRDVQEVCSTIQVNPTTLLGIVKNGGIVNALCPDLKFTTSSIRSIPPATTATSRTISTATALPVASTTAKTSQTVISLSIVSSIVTSTSTSASASASESDSDSSTADAPQTSATSISSATTPVAVPVTTTSTNKIAAAATSSTKSKATTKADQGSGGGSPFDISSSGSIDGHNSVLGLVLVLVWAGLILGR
ncbi:hypothetical protein WAI453_008506 [Rhynchosporium graminicola]